MTHLLSFALALTVGTVTPSTDDPSRPEGATNSNTNVQQGPGSTQDVADRIADLRRVLLQPGPEVREQRESAVDELLLMADRRAHVVLCEMLSKRAEAPVGLTARILDSLERKWRQPRDPVFGEANAERAGLHRLYATTLVRVFDRDPAIAPAGHPHAATQELVWRCFRALLPADRKRVFDTLTSAGDDAQRRLTMWAIAGSRDLGAAPFLAKALDDGGVTGSTARAALSMLTFVEGSFGSLAEFQKWYAANRDRRYVDLAEAAARSRNESAQTRRSALEAQLITALVAAEEVDWKQVAGILRRPATAAAMVTFLQHLHAALANKTSLGGSPEDRLSLVKTLVATLDSGLRSEDLGLRLEVLARLVVNGEADASGVVERLVAGLSHEDVVVRVAALRGLTQHFSTSNRRVVVAAGLAALESGELKIVEGALSCLGQRNWVAPSAGEAADAQAWHTFLDRVLVPSLPLEFKELAIEVAVQPTAEKTRSPQSFDLLMNVVSAERKLEVTVRQQALSGLRLFTEDEARADRYVRFVAGLMVDDEPSEIRASAARMLGTLPEGSRKTRDEVWVPLVVKNVGGRLAVETEEAPMRAALDCLMKLAGGPESPTNVIGKFSGAVEAYLATEESARKPFQREVLVEGLRRLGAVDRRPIGQWTRAASGLARLEDRTALRFVLDRQRVSELKDRDGASVVAAWRLVVEAGLLKPADRTWRSNATEAAQVELAFSELERLKELPDEARHRALRVVVLAALDKQDDVLTRGKDALSKQDRPLDRAERDAITTAVASAHLAKSQLVDAAAMLDTLEDKAAPSALRIRTDLARAHMGRNEYGSASTVIQVALVATPEENPAFPERFLVAQEAQFRTNPKGNAAKVAEALRARRGMFTAESTPAPLKAQFAALLAEVEKAQG